MLSVRELSPKEIPHIVRYWSEASDDQLNKMGADKSRIPSVKELTSMLNTSLIRDIEERNSYCLIWFDDHRPIGHCNTNPTSYGDEAYMHLHLWSAEDRRKGIGSEAIAQCVPIFFDRLKLKRLYSQPKASNIAAINTLRKCGFSFIKNYTTIPGSVNYKQEVSLWSIDKEEL